MSKGNTLLYQYIAASEPGFVRSICTQYGYQVPQVKNLRELGDLLSQLVRNEGEPAFKDIIDNHPDKELILELFGQVKGDHVGADGKSSSGCGCKDCGGCKDKEKFSNATGPAEISQNQANTNAIQNTAAHITSTQTGVVILSCAVIIALAIMAKK